MTAPKANRGAVSDAILTALAKYKDPEAVSAGEVAIEAARVLSRNGHAKSAADINSQSVHNVRSRLRLSLGGPITAEAIASIQKTKAPPQAKDAAPQTAAHETASNTGRFQKMPSRRAGLFTTAKYLLAKEFCRQVGGVDTALRLIRAWADLSKR